MRRSWSSPLALTLSLSLGAACAVPAQSPLAGSRDTIDVPVGASVLNTSGMRAFVTHLRTYRVANGDTVPLRESTNTIAFGEEQGRAVTRVASESATPAGRVTDTMTFTFDRRTLALLGIRQASARGATSLTSSGTTLAGTFAGPGGIRTVAAQLPSAAFYGGWSDFVVEELPHRLGAVYRVPLWRPRPNADGTVGAALEPHLYVFQRREDVTVAGTVHRNAWVVDDRSADGATSLGTMWIVDEAPKLVRWIIHDPSGDVTIDQTLVTTQQPGR